MIDKFAERGLRSLAVARQVINFFLTTWPHEQLSLISFLNIGFS